MNMQLGGRSQALDLNSLVAMIELRRLGGVEERLDRQIVVIWLEIGWQPIVNSGRSPRRAIGRGRIARAL